MAWWWGVLLFIGGIFVGFMLMAVLAANSAYFAKEERDCEQRETSGRNGGGMENAGATKSRSYRSDR